MEKENNLENTSLSFSLPNHELALLPNPDMHIYVFAICWPRADVLQKCCGRAEGI